MRLQSQWAKFKKVGLEMGKIVGKLNRRDEEIWKGGSFVRMGTFNK